jgi:hypothetical protein
MDIEHGGNRTHDHQDRNLTLYPLSYTLGVLLFNIEPYYIDFLFYRIVYYDN